MRRRWLEDNEKEVKNPFLVRGGSAQQMRRNMEIGS